MLSGRRDYRGYIYHPGSWTPLAQTHHHALVQTPQVWWYGTDTTGAPVELTDTTGETVWRAQRLAWGNLTDEAWLAEGADNCLRLPGQYEDRETGLFYNLHRYYDPRHGRYITPAPVGLAGGLNAYAYVDGNPVGYVDPLGLKGMPGSDTYPTGDRTPEPIGAANGSFSWDKYDEIPVLPDAAPGDYNYRGVHRGHPDADNNITGRVNPGNVDSKISPEEHNLGGFSGDSPYASWTDDPMIARRFSGEDGIILRVKLGAPKPGDTWSWDMSIDEYLEREILLKGPRSGDVEVFYHEGI